MTRSITRPMALIPAPPISLLFAGDFPHASGKTFSTAFQNVKTLAQITSVSECPVAKFRYGNRHPDGVVRLSCSIWIIEVSATTALLLAAVVIDDLMIRPLKGE